MVGNVEARKIEENVEKMMQFCLMLVFTENEFVVDIKTEDIADTGMCSSFHCKLVGYSYVLHAIMKQM